MSAQPSTQPETLAVPAALPERQRTVNSPNRSPVPVPIRGSGARQKVQLADVVFDFLIVWVAGLWALAFHPVFTPRWSFAIRGVTGNDSQSIALVFLYSCLAVMSCHAQSLYRASSHFTPGDEARTALRACFTAVVVWVSFIYVADGALQREAVALTAGVSSAAMVLWRKGRRRLRTRRFERGIGVRNVLIVGAGRVGQSIAEYIDDHCELGLRVVGFLDERNVQGAAVLGTLADLPRIARRNFVDEVFITSSERSVLRDIADHASSNRMDVKVVPEIFNGLGYGAPLHYLGEFPVIELHSQKIPAYGLVIKRMMDIAFSASALAFASPLLALIALAIKIDSRGPVIYRSTRVGRRGRHFTCFKFRTMVLDAHEMQKDLHHLNERNGPLFKISNDPRITRLGQFLRKWSLDEIPQFFNVLIGDMSLVGPRPAVPEEVHQYSEREVARMAVQPGLTGLWQVTARQDPSFETYVRLDLHYIRHWTLLLDFDILLRTVPAVLRGTGV